MTNIERMKHGKVYNPDDTTLLAEQLEAQELNDRYNELRRSEMNLKEDMLQQMFAEFGTGGMIETPFHANWGGKHVHVGKNFYANFNLTLVDDGEIYIGNDTMFGPNVTIATAGHLIYPAIRAKHYQFNKTVKIGNNVWLGSNVTVLPGVTIGDNSVIGAGSIVTKDIPANVVAVGIPCKVLREINQHDHDYFYKDEKLDIWE
ncbi:sugar O-acetyltransferase [Companilactobacillus sp. HBUAS56257]|uniref:sugar O-acetyltransferase n=1 Tax=Companilactobacillus sp. HBUAS56257 TaxID=3109360 RepID=UPI002FEEF99C